MSKVGICELYRYEYMNKYINKGEGKALPCTQVPTNKSGRKEGIRKATLDNYHSNR